MKKKKIMVFGTFDLLHHGHLSFFAQAKKLGDLLIVSVARDKNVKKVKRRRPDQNERERLKNVQKVKLVNTAFLASLDDPWSQIIKVNPDIIALGYDQRIYVDEGGVRELGKLLRQKKLSARVVRLRSYKPSIYKTSIIRSHKQK